MNRASSALACLPILLAACASGDAPAKRTDVASAGDTTVATSHGDAPVVRPDSVVVLYRSDELEEPTSLARMGDRLLVGDRNRVHVVPLDGSAATVFGREGGGPGEFRGTLQVGAVGDTVLVHDARLLRLSRFSPTGEFLSSVKVTPQAPYVNRTRETEALVPYGPGLLWTRDENVNLERPVRRALVVHDLAADTQRVVAEWDDIEWTRIGNAIGPRALFPPRALVAVAQDGRYAYGDGQEYCFHVTRPDSAAVLRVCRDWTRAAAGDEVRSPDASRLDDPSQRKLLEALSHLEVGELMPSYDALRFGADGTIWVRTVGEAQAQVHPFIARMVEGAAPPTRNWDVFDRDGALVRTVELPSEFDPLVFGADRVWGVLELDTGEQTIGEARLLRQDG